MSCGFCMNALTNIFDLATYQKEPLKAIDYDY